MEVQGTVEGTVERLVFQNQDNGYTVLQLLTDQGELVTVVGCIPCAGPGESMTVTGDWVNHPTYGQQLAAQLVERRMPRDEEEIAVYLASGIVKGIGPATAQRLVERFGADTLQVLEEEPERLTCIKGISAQKAREISRAFRELTGLRRLMEYMARYELPMHLAMQLYRSYGSEALARLREDPYILSRQRYGVEFAVVDEIGLSMELPADAPCRVEAAILYELAYNMGNGHVFLPREKLVAATAQLIDVSADTVEVALDRLIGLHQVVQQPIANVTGCYLFSCHQAECQVAEKLLELVRTPRKTAGGVDKLVSRMERDRGIAYAPQQRQAVVLAAEQGVVLLTGGPGTGKTTAVEAMVALYEKMGLEVLLLAPTGRAAQRLGEVCGTSAQTIHRALGMSLDDFTGEVKFRKNASDPLEADAVIVDEMSMVDLALMSALLTALRPGCRLVMVGDPDQLPSVGAGNVLGDILRSGVVPTVTLREIFRQAEKSAIIRNAHAVNLGMAPNLDSNQGDFFFLCRRNPHRLVQTVVELVKTRLPEHMHIPKEQIQVLTPTRKGEMGTVQLNRALQAALNPPAKDKRQKVWGDVVFRTGDRVMQTKNNYDVIWEKEDGTAGSGVFNGDMGIIRDIDPSGELITVAFDDRTAVYTPDLLSQLDLAYAVTVHKAQGSEYRAVLLVSAPAAPSLMVRSVLYTAITRARELLVLVGDDGIPGRMAADDRRQRRYSGLRRRLKEAGQQA